MIPLSGTDPATKTSFVRKHAGAVTALLLALVAMVLYLPSLQYGFVHYDDVRLLLDYPALFGQSTLSADLKGIFITQFPREEPLLLRDVSWAIESRVFGFGNPFGYHLGNVLFHSINVGLLFAFLYATTRRWIVAFWTTLAFVAVAVHTEPVAWIMGRKDILSTFFMLLALLMQTGRFNARTVAARWSFYLATLFFATAAMFSKINGLSFPLVLFLHALCYPHLAGEQTPDGPLFRGRTLLREILLMVPFGVVTGLIFSWYHGILNQGQIVGQTYTSGGLAHAWNLLMVDPIIFWIYLKQIFFPKDLTLFYSTFPQSSYSPWQIVSSIGTVIGILVLGIWSFRKRKDLFFYLAAFIALMIPYMNLVKVPVWMAERYVYFSSFCLLAVVVSLFVSVLKNARPAARLLAGVFAFTFFALNLYQTLSYQPKWRNAETLWQYHLALPDPNPVAFENLAAYYYGAATTAGTTNSAVALRKMTVVLDAGFAQFWPDQKQPPPQSTWYLFFLKSLVQEVTGDLKGALNSLLTSDQLRHPFDPTSQNLARLYRTLAKNTTDPKEREAYARASHQRFLEYTANRFPGRPAPAEDQDELRSLEKDFPFLSEPVQQPNAPGHK